MTLFHALLAVGGLSSAIVIVWRTYDVTHKRHEQVRRAVKAARARDRRKTWDAEHEAGIVASALVVNDNRKGSGSGSTMVAERSNNATHPTPRRAANEHWQPMQPARVVPVSGGFSSLAPSAAEVEARRREALAVGHERYMLAEADKIAARVRQDELAEADATSARMGYYELAEQDARFEMALRRYVWYPTFDPAPVVAGILGWAAFFVARVLGLETNPSLAIGAGVLVVSSAVLLWVPARRQTRLT